MKKAAPKKKKAVSALAKSYGGDYSTLDFQEGFWRRHWKEAIILLFMAFALYWMTLSYGYVLDDQIVITDNNYTKQGFKGIGKILSTESFEGYFGEQKDLVAGARYPAFQQYSALRHHGSASVPPVLHSSAQPGQPATLVAGHTFSYGCTLHSSPHPH
jgi:hypothetical protein